MVIWLNGTFLSPDDARLSPLDAGLQHGVGLFETLQARGGRVFRLQDHLERLRRSAESLELMSTLRTEPLAEAVAEVAKKWGEKDARIRVTLTGGVVNMLKASRDAAPAVIEPTLLIVASAATPFPPQLFERGVGVAVSDQRVASSDRFAAHKTVAYWPRLFALRQAARLGASESLWFDTRGRLASGCTSNVFLIKGGELQTPNSGDEVDGSPVLPGIARRTVCELAPTLGMEVRRRELVIDDVLSADECFLTNAAWGVLPVVRVEQSKVGGGEPGEGTRKLRKGWLERVAAECSSSAA
ncbi:MAG: aminotransferase class IV [Planctomycetes bacterium]|nr:aminotransferase class IV [Planctomycetota bacterium]